MKSILYPFLLLVFTISIKAQSTEELIKSIRSEYQKINSNIDTYTQKEAYYTEEEAYWMNVQYTGYLDNKNQLVLLKFSVGEEGYWSSYEMYFKDENIIFIYNESGEPDESERQDRIYFHNRRIIRALMKSKSGSLNKTFDQIENINNVEIMNDVEQSSIDYLKNVDAHVSQFWQVLDKE
jgi:cytochrome oxidase assembly protein ShyY1